MPTAAVSSDLLTEQEAAERAKVSRKTIRRLIEQGRLEAADYGTQGQRNYRIDPAALAKVGAGPAPDAPGPVEITPPAPRPRRGSRRRAAASAAAAAYLPRVSA